MNTDSLMKYLILKWVPYYVLQVKIYCWLFYTFYVIVFYKTHYNRLLFTVRYCCNTLQFISVLVWGSYEETRFLFYYVFQDDESEVKRIKSFFKCIQKMYNYMMFASYLSSSSSLINSSSCHIMFTKERFRHHSFSDFRFRLMERVKHPPVFKDMKILTYVLSQDKSY